MIPHVTNSQDLTQEIFPLRRTHSLVINIKKENLDNTPVIPSEKERLYTERPPETLFSRPFWQELQDRELRFKFGGMSPEQEKNALGTIIRKVAERGGCEEKEATFILRIIELANPCNSAKIKQLIRTIKELKIIPEEELESAAFNCFSKKAMDPLALGFFFNEYPTQKHRFLSFAKNWLSSEIKRPSLHRILPFLHLLNNIQECDSLYLMLLDIPENALREDPQNALVLINILLSLEGLRGQQQQAVFTMAKICVDEIAAIAKTYLSYNKCIDPIIYFPLANTAQLLGRYGIVFDNSSFFLIKRYITFNKDERLLDLLKGMHPTAQGQLLDKTFPKDEDAYRFWYEHQEMEELIYWILSRAKANAPLRSLVYHPAVKNDAQLIEKCLSLLQDCKEAEEFLLYLAPLLFESNIPAYLRMEGNRLTIFQRFTPQVIDCLTREEDILEYLEFLHHESLLGKFLPHIPHFWFFHVKDPDIAEECFLYLGSSSIFLLEHVPASRKVVNYFLTAEWPEQYKTQFIIKAISLLKEIDKKARLALTPRILEESVKTVSCSSVDADYWIQKIGKPLAEYALSFTDKKMAALAFPLVCHLYRQSRGSGWLIPLLERFMNKWDSFKKDEKVYRALLEMCAGPLNEGLTLAKILMQKKDCLDLALFLLQKETDSPELPSLVAKALEHISAKNAALISSLIQQGQLNGEVKHAFLSKTMQCMAGVKDPSSLLELFKTHFLPYIENNASTKGALELVGALITRLPEQLELIFAAVDLISPKITGKERIKLARHLLPLKTAIEKIALLIEDAYKEIKDPLEFYGAIYPLIFDSKDDKIINVLKKFRAAPLNLNNNSRDMQQVMQVLLILEIHDFKMNPQHLIPQLKKTLQFCLGSRNFKLACDIFVGGYDCYLRDNKKASLDLFYLLIDEIEDRPHEIITLSSSFQTKLSIDDSQIFEELHTISLRMAYNGKCPLDQKLQIVMSTRDLMQKAAQTGMFTKDTKKMESIADTFLFSCIKLCRDTKNYIFLKPAVTGLNFLMTYYQDGPNAWKNRVQALLLNIILKNAEDDDFVTIAKFLAKELA